MLKPSSEEQEFGVIRKNIAMVVLAGLIVMGWARMGFGQTGGHLATPKVAEPKIAGVWRGNSGCQVKDSPCHDETNVYRFTAIACKAGAFSLIWVQVPDGHE